MSSDPEAEYLAAKAAFVAAHKRLVAAKAAMKPIWKAQETAQQQAHIQRLVMAAEALVAGAPRKEVVVLGGRSASYYSISDLLRAFWRSVLSHEEIYQDLDNYRLDDGQWELSVTKRALERYHARQAA
jgi:hypothetical protein